jgi:hypothetical protein
LLPFVAVEVADFVEASEVGVADGLLVFLLGEVASQDEELANGYAHGGGKFLEGDGPRHVAVVEQRAEGGVRYTCALSEG